MRWEAQTLRSEGGAQRATAGTPAGSAALLHTAAVYTVASSNSGGSAATSCTPSV